MDAEAPATFHIVGDIRDQFKRDRAKMGIIEWSLDRVESLNDRAMILDVLGIRVVHVLADLIGPGPTLEGSPIAESQDSRGLIVDHHSNVCTSFRVPEKELLSGGGEYGVR